MATIKATPVTQSQSTPRHRTLFGHPLGLYPLFFTEMWERFGFYLMIAVLPLYLSDKDKGGLGWSDEQTAVLVGSYNGLVYFTPFIGGLIADRLLGYRRTIVIGAILMMLGYLTLALPMSWALWIGLAVIITGNGAFKPNISTLLGNLYPPGSPNKDAGYNIFYMGVNIGAFTCAFVAAIVRNYVDEHPLHLPIGYTLNGWEAAFGTAGIGMLIGLILFLCTYPMFGRAEPERNREADGAASLTPLWLECLVPAVLVGGLFAAVTYYWGKDLHIPFNPVTAAFFAACIPVVIFFINIWRRVRDTFERRRVLALLVIFAVAVVFWTTFYLPNTALTFWARDNTNRQAAGAIEPVAKTIPDLTENAPPSYWANAGPQVPRPARRSLIVVSPEKYKQLEKEHKLSVVEGKPIYVTPQMEQEIYARADANTPTLPTGQHLKLVNTEEYQSINPLYIILFTPLVVLGWGIARRWGAEPSTPTKMGIGLLLAAAGPLIMLGAVLVSQNGLNKVSGWWIAGYYVPITVGELLLSPMGLSLVNKMAPKQISAMMMGGWFLATAIGAKMSGILGEEYTQIDHRMFWGMLIALNAAFGILLLALVPWLNRQMNSGPATNKAES